MNFHEAGNPHDTACDTGQASRTLACSAVWLSRAGERPA